MALKVSTGISRKLGLPDYCSIGASCHVEFELDQALLHSDLDGLQQQIHDAYVACSQAVDDELARQKDRPHTSNGNANGKPTEPSVPQPSSNGNDNGSNGRPATDKQLKFIGNLARQIRGLGNGKLAQISSRMFGKDVGSITSLEASGLIDTLKAVREGRLDLAAAINGAEHE